jgi:hypothetical protein
MSDVFTFKEIDVPGPLKVELRSYDAPFGRPHTLAAFESGGEVKRTKTELPGRTEPVFQVRVANSQRDLEVSGAFRDFRMGAGHARAMRDAVERLRLRANLLQITWGDDTWKGLLVETKYGHEGVGHLPYTLRFEIASGPGSETAVQPVARRGGADALDAVLAQLRARRAPPAALERNFLDAFNAVMSSIDSGMEAVSDAARTGEEFANRANRAARRITSLATQVQGKVAELDSMMGGLRASAMSTLRQAASVADVDAWRFSILGLGGDLKTALRETKAEERRREREGTKLYVVKPGDTLESIARSALGDAGRAGSLGYQPRDLIPGRLIRVPEA